MALVPDNEADYLEEVLDSGEETETVEPSKTWSIDFENKTIGSFVDEEMALRQFIRKAIVTERSKYAIYSDDYGCELFDLIGEDIPIELLDSEIPRMVTEALIYDDRIEDVQVSFTRNSDKLFISVTVLPINQDSEIFEEVMVDNV